MNAQWNKYNISRCELSKDRSLRSWSAADEYLLQAANALESNPLQLGIYNDRFGFLGSHLNSINTTIILTYKSQKKAIEYNFTTNKIPLPNFSYPLSPLDNKMDFALVKIPKSIELFQLFLEHITHNSTANITVVCAFMTRHFSPRLLEIAKEYFEVVEQSKAIKKARLLTLTNKKKPIKREIISSIVYNDQVYKQYLGGFSASHIDYATQFFLDNLQIKKTDKRILDLGSGNGIIGNEIHKQLPNAELHLMDDSYLAVSSAELNIHGKNIHHHTNNELSIFDNNTFDLIVTNPPFHFEYEINIQISLELFKGCFRCLKDSGILQIVANKHLNYKVHLEPLFSSVQVLAENHKFIVYSCVK